MDYKQLNPIELAAITEPTAQEAAAFAAEAVISTLQRGEVAPHANYFRPQTLFGETWDDIALRSRYSLEESAKRTALDQGQTLEQWNQLSQNARSGHVPSRLVLGARILNEVTEYEHKKLCLTWASMLLKDMVNLEPYPETASDLPEL